MRTQASRNRVGSASAGFWSRRRPGNRKSGPVRLVWQDATAKLVRLIAQEAAMDTEKAYRVVIDCPKTHREVDTGLVLTEAAFARFELRHGVVNCPHCAERHGYDMAEARLQVQAGVVLPFRARRFNRHPYRRQHHRWPSRT